MSLSQEAIQTLQRTWKKMTAIGMEEFGLKLLYRLFIDEPETTTYFRGMGLDEIELTMEGMRESKRVAFHAKSVATSITEILDSLGKENGPQKVFKRLAAIHHRKKVDTENFDLMGNVLLKIITSSLTGADATPEVVMLWKVAYDAIKEGIVKDM